MRDGERFEPGSALFTFVNAATQPGALQNTPRNADAHSVGREIMVGDPSGNNVLAAHAIYGKADLLLILKGASFSDAIGQLHSKVRDRTIGTKSYISGSETYPITGWYGSPLERPTFEDDGMISAWVLAVVGVADPTDLIAAGLLQIDGVVAVAPLLGPWDVVMYVKHATHNMIQWTVDKEIRPNAHFISTTTLSVTRPLTRKPCDNVA